MFTFRYRKHLGLNAVQMYVPLTSMQAAAEISESLSSGGRVLTTTLGRTDDDDEQSLLPPPNPLVSLLSGIWLHLKLYKKKNISSFSLPTNCNHTHTHQLTQIFYLINLFFSIKYFLHQFFFCGYYKFL